MPISPIKCYRILYHPCDVRESFFCKGRHLSYHAHRVVEEIFKLWPFKKLLNFMGLRIKKFK